MAVPFSAEPARESLKLRPDSPQAWHNLGLASSRQGDLDEAVKAYREAVRLKPDYASAWHNLGLIYARRRRFDEAVAACREAVRHEPDNATYWFIFGLASRDKGDRSAFEEAYRRLKALDPAKAEELRKKRGSR